MKPRIFKIYQEAFGRISKEVWWLSLIMLVNRVGSMVFPFLSLYLIHHLRFSDIQAGWILTAFGLGGMVGALLGGWVSDRFGYFKIQFISLFIGGIGWFFLLGIKHFESLIIFLFVQSTITDMLRPANSSSIVFFSNRKNLTNSYSLNRMAMNLGYTLGPAVGGLLASISYAWLFIADGITSILAAVIFIFIFHKYFNSHPCDQPTLFEKTKYERTINPLKEISFLIFIIGVIAFAFIFFQLLFTFPLFCKEKIMMTEGQVGLILAFNGLCVFCIEMIFVNTIGKKWNKKNLIVFGTILVGLSFYVLNISPNLTGIIISMILLCIGEIMVMPFMSTYISEIAPQAGLGRYMALYSLAYSVALILAPFIGLRIKLYWGYENLWSICLALSVITALLFEILFRLEYKKQLRASI